jgi:hypothetical protein
MKQSRMRTSDERRQRTHPQLSTEQIGWLAIVGIAALT